MTAWRVVCCQDDYDEAVFLVDPLRLRMEVGRFPLRHAAPRL